jgi:uncharacterized protein (TIGR03437 family)
MLRWLCSLICLVGLATPASAQNVRITWIGQACFYVQTEGGPTVVVDPPAANVGYALPATPADVVTVSHNHSDHNNSAGVRGTFTLVDGRPTTARTEMTAANLPFVLVPGFHDAAGGAQRGRNTIVRWTQGGIRFAHFGDYGQASLTEAQLADLRGLDVVMVPAGGFFTVDVQQTAALIAELQPRVAILMHFRTALGGPAQLASLPAVTGPFPGIRYQPAAVTLTSAALPAAPEVWIMEPAADTFVANAAGSVLGAPVSASGLATAYGEFAGSATAEYAAFPLSRKLGETEVLIAGEAAPLVYVSPRQVNFQVPGALPSGQSVIEVRVGGQRVGRGTITTVARAPGLFVAVDQDGRVNRGRRGGYLTIYASGQGSVTPPVADGAVALVDPLSVTGDTPMVSVGGRPATVLFSGMTPGFAGLWQVNARIPEDVPPGSEIDLVVQFQSNIRSNALKLTID